MVRLTAFGWGWISGLCLAMALAFPVTATSSETVSGAPAANGARAAGSRFHAALVSVRAAAAEIRLDTLQPEADRKLKDSLDFLDSTAAATGWALAAHDLPATGGEEKRARENRMRGAFQFVKNVTNGFIRRHLDSARQEVLLAPMNAFATEELENALKDRMRNLEMLEIKYGPNSARLNLLEMAVNHFILRGIDAFGVDGEGRPGPLEMVIAYSTSYLTPSWSKRDGTGLIITSAVEAGLRVYILKHGWGRNALLPAYFSVGGVMAAKEGGVLRNPFETTPDFGGFLSWGAVKAAVIVVEDEPRLLLNRQFQFLPYLF
jgi:hypothetical protein